MPNNIIIDGGIITQTVDSGSTGQKSIVLRTKDTYVLKDIQVNVSASATAGRFANSVSAADESSYTPNNLPSTVIPAGGSLYLSGGWYSKQKISLAHLIPDIAENDAGTDQILFGYSAYDENGNQITGTITTQTPSFDGGDVSTTATLHYTAPSARISPDGRFVPDANGGEYGITDHKPSGTEGIDFLFVGAELENVTDGSAYATSTANRTDVLYDGSVHYFVDESDNTVALQAPSANATNQSATQNISISSIVTNNFGKYWIPIVTPQGGGGTVSKTGQSGTVTCTLDNVTLASSGKFTEVGNGEVGANYGVHSYSPTTQNPDPSGIDGTDYLKIKTSGSGGNATVSGTINVAYSRAAVNANNTYRGLVSMGRETQLLDSRDGTLAANVSATGTATITGGSYYYIDIVEPKGSAPSITATGISDTLEFSNGAPTVTSYIKGTIVPGTETNQLGDEYGVSVRVPSGIDGVNFLTIIPEGNASSGTLSGNTTITFTRGAVNANATYKGAVSMTTSTELVAQAPGQTVTRSLSKTITPNTTSGDKLYIPVVSPCADTPDFTSVTNPTVTTTTSAAKKVGSSSPTTAPSGVVTSTTAPSDLTSYSAGYIIVSPGSSSSSNGSITASATASMAAGITKGGTSSATSNTYSTISTTVNNDNGAKTYIKIYDGSYSIS